jgi:tetratricopeptide (TPR) repeat protein
VATDLNNLAVLHYNQGQYAAAEPLYKRALAIRGASLAPNHPAVARSLNNLAGLYRKTGRVKEAEGLEQRAARIEALAR